MGFRPEPTILNLSFKDTPYDGLNVRMSVCTLGEYDEMMRSSLQIREEMPTNLEGKEAAEELARRASELMASNSRVIELFTHHLVSWNVEDLTGQPVPADRAGVDSQERSFISDLVSSWQTAMVNVPNRLQTESSDGSTSEEQSLGLGNASQNLEN